jgi:hypothetical protein
VEPAPKTCLDTLKALSYYTGPSDILSKMIHRESLDPESESWKALCAIERVPEGGQLIDQGRAQNGQIAMGNEEPNIRLV